MIYTKESYVIALEASWELDPVLLDDQLWDAVSLEKTKVERLSNENEKRLINSGFEAL